MCCSGHAFGSPYFEQIENDKDLDSIEDAILLYEYLPDYEGIFACCQGKPEPGTFIKIEKDVEFQSLPEGWIYEKRFLKFDLSMQDNPSLYYAKLTLGTLKFAELADAMATGELENVKKSAREFCVLVDDRNKKCRLLK